MLKKLIKHEWKDTYSVGSVCSIVVVVLTIIGMILFSLDIWNESASRNNDMAEGFTAIMIMLYFVMMFYGVVALVMVVRYYYFWRYYKNFFTDQGYLMNTLPVKSTELLKSKLIVAVVWQYITAIVVGIAIVLLVFSMIMGLSGYAMAEFMEELNEVLRDFYNEVFLDPQFVKIVPALIGYIVILVIGPIFDMLLMYAAVGIGQTAKKHKFLLAVLILIGFNLAIQTISSFASVPFTLMMEEDMTFTVYNVWIVAIAIIMVGGSIGLYFLNKFFLEKRLNLE